jgi:hypothetical protein
MARFNHRERGAWFPAQSALWGLQAKGKWTEFARTKRGKEAVDAWHKWRKTAWGVYLGDELPALAWSSSAEAYASVSPYIDAVAEVFA